MLQEVEPHEAIEMELDEEEDSAVYKHLYDDKPFLLTKMVNGPSYRRWKLPLPVSHPHSLHSVCPNLRIRARPPLHLRGSLKAT